MYVTCVWVECGSALREFQYHTTLAHYTLAGSNTIEQLHVTAIGGTYLYTTFLKRYRIVLHKDKHVAHLLDKRRTWNGNMMHIVGD